MYLIVALCILCSWVVPHSCRSVDTREPPSGELEPFISHHHHEGNIAELLIPLLERSLAQSEARDNERAHRRSKGKKVIQVLPYRGSEEHKRKGWRKLNSQKKQVVEITPLHGKNGAKPLAYILSAAKPKHADHAKTNDEVSSSNTSEMEHYKSTSEEQHSFEDKENREDVSTLKVGDDVDSPSASTNVQSSEDANSKQSKDLSASDNESDDATVESDATIEKSEEKKVVVIEESEDEELEEPQSINLLLHDHLHNLVKPVSEEAATIEEDDATVENESAAVDDVAATVENATPYSVIEDKDTTIEDVDATKDADATVEAADETVESRAATIEDLGVTVEDVGLTVEEIAATVEDVEVTIDDRAATVEDVDVTVEDKAATIEEEQATVEDNATVEGKTGAIVDHVAVTVEHQLAVEDDETAAATVEADATDEQDASVEDATVERQAAIENRNVVNNVPDIYDLLKKEHTHIGRAATVENEDSVENDQGYMEDDIVISRGLNESNSAEQRINKLVNSRARDIIELIQSSVEASTAPQRDCLEKAEKHHDHKSYRLSFLFNK